ERHRGQLGPRSGTEATVADDDAADPVDRPEELGDQEGRGARSVREHGDDALLEDGGEQRAAGADVHLRRAQRCRDRAAQVSGGTMAAENSFDIACKIDMQEVTNALDQARREIETRYDLKGTKNEVTLDKTDIILLSPDDMKLKAVTDILQSKLHKRGVPLKALTYGTVETASGGVLRQKIGLQQGIPMEKAKEIVRVVKDSKIRVQVSINEDKVRISGKSRDDLQAVMKLVRDKDFGIALSFDNRRTI